MGKEVVLKTVMAGLLISGVHEVVAADTLEEPDKEAVAKLMPARSEIVAQPSVAALPAASPSVSGTGGVASQGNSKVEARKSLAGMGLTYHSVEHFFAAIRRDDDVAVQLFLAAGTMKVLTKDADGKTPEQAALESSASASWEAIRQFAADNPQAAVKEPNKPAADPAHALAAAREFLSPEVLEGIERMIKEQRLTGAEAEAFRTKATLQYSLQFKGVPKTMMK